MFCPVMSPAAMGTAVAAWFAENAVVSPARVCPLSHATWALRICVLSCHWLPGAWLLQAAAEPHAAVNTRIPASDQLRLWRSLSPATPTGPGASGFFQGDHHNGMTRTRWSSLAFLINGVGKAGVSPAQQQCQGAKPVLLNVGEASKPYPWVPKVTEVSLLRLGSFVSCGRPEGSGGLGGQLVRRTARGGMAGLASTERRLAQLKPGSTAQQLGSSWVALACTCQAAPSRLLLQRTAGCHHPMDLPVDRKLNTLCLCLHLPVLALPLSGGCLCPRRVQHYGWPAAAQGGTVHTGACLGP